MTTKTEQREHEFIARLASLSGDQYDALDAAERAVLVATYVALFPSGAVKKRSFPAGARGKPVREALADAPIEERRMDHLRAEARSRINALLDGEDVPGPVALPLRLNTETYTLEVAVREGGAAPRCLMALARSLTLGTRLPFRRCRWCGDIFAPERGSSRFCSGSCKQKSYDEPRREERNRKARERYHATKRGN